MKSLLKGKKTGKKNQYCQNLLRRLKKAMSVSYFSVFSNEILHRDYFSCKDIKLRKYIDLASKFLQNRKNRMF